MSEEKSPNTKKPSHNIDISFNLTEILKLLIVEHFWPTLIGIICVAIFYICGTYNIDIISGISDMIASYSVNWYHLVILMLLSGYGIILLLFNKKVIKLHEITEFTNSCNTAIKDNLEKLRDDFIKIKDNIIKLEANVSDSKTSVKVLSDLVTENVLDTQKIITEIIKINNSIKKRPEKEMILNTVSLRTRVISIQILESISEYFINSTCMQIQTSSSSKSSKSKVDSNNSSRNEFIISKFRHKLNDIKSQYFEEIYQLSKGAIESNIEHEALKLLNEAFESIIDYLVANMDKPNTYDQITYNVNTTIEQVTNRLVDLYSMNIQSDFVIELEENKF